LLIGDLDGQLSFADFVKQKRDAAAAAAANEPHLFNLLTDDELVAENQVCYAHSTLNVFIVTTRFLCLCVYLNCVFSRGNPGEHTLRARPLWRQRADG
jgi:hypothetical protein